MNMHSWIRKLFARPITSRICYRPRLEALEDRNAPAIIPVTTLDDSGAHSLRQAILDANATSAEADTISIQVTGTINLTSGLPALSTNINIQGAGPNWLIMRGGGDFAIVNVSSGGNVTLSGVTITNGINGIGNSGTLTLNNVAVIANDTGGSGGGISNDGWLTLNNSTVGWNVSALSGGGIYNTGTLILNNSTVSGNYAWAVGTGGIENGGTLTVNNSTVSDNQGTPNESGVGGVGGIANYGTLSLNSSTISDNIGAGLNNGATATVRNTIVSWNESHLGGPLDVAGAFSSQGFNLIRSGSGATGFNGPGDQVGASASPIDPLLGPLQDNGGFAWTRALLPGSPAIDAGDPAATGDFDQRGLARIVDGNNDGTARIDIGAYEVQNPPPRDNTPPVAQDQSVTTNEDEWAYITLTGSDADHDVLSYPLLSQPLHGTLIGWGGTVVYRPDSNYNGPDSFTFKVNDGRADSSVATVSVNVNPVNDPPWATADDYSVRAGGTLMVSAPGVLGNDSDPDGDIPLTAALVYGPSHGTLTFNSNGSFTYVQNGSAATRDTFSYRASDGTLSGLPTVVYITVVPTPYVRSTSPNAYYPADAIVPIVVTFEQAVNVTGTPQLTLNNGAVVNYSSGSGPSSLTFNYTVAPGDDIAHLDYASASALALNGGTIKDSGGNDVNLTLPEPGTVGSLGANNTIGIDTTKPIIDASPDRPANANGWYNADVTVTFNGADSLSGIAFITSPITLSTEGANQSVNGFVSDKAGNSNSTTLTGINIDKTAPATTLTSTPPAITDSDSATFVWSGSDSLSGVAAYEYSLDGDAWMSTSDTTLTLTDLAKRAYTFQVRAVDRAGHSDATPAAFAWDRPLIRNDFSSGTLDPAWLIKGGNYNVSVGGNLVGTDPNVYPVTNIAVYNIPLVNAWVQVDINLAVNHGAGLIARYQPNGSYYLGMICGNGTSYNAYLFRYSPGVGFTQLSAIPIGGGTGTLRLEVVGTEQKLFFGTDAEHLSHVTYAHDAGITAAGLCGVRSTKNAQLDNFLTNSITLTTPLLPFFGDFTPATVGSQLSRNWTEQDGNFSVEESALVAHDPNLFPYSNIATVNGMSLADVSVQTHINPAVNQGAGVIARYQPDGSYYLGMIHGNGASYTAYLFRYNPGVGFTQLSAVPSGRGAGTLRLEVLGTEQKLFFGPDADHLSLITYAHDAGITTAGLCGVRATRNAHLDTFRAEAIALTTPNPIADHFTQPDGSQLARNWTEQYGNFSVQSNALVAHDPNVYPYANIATINGVSLANVSVQAKIDITVNQAAGLIARYQSDGSYYLGMIDGNGTTFVPYIFRYVPAVGFTQQSTGQTGSGSGSGTLRLEVVGNSLKLYLDAGLLTTATDSTISAITTKGTVGVRARKDAIIDDFAATPLS